MGRTRTTTRYRRWRSIVMALAVTSLFVGNGTPVLRSRLETELSRPAGASYDSTIAASPAPAQTAIAQPNIVFVMTDDMRLSDPDRVADLKPGGGFDWLRQNGLRFSRMWNTNNLCCPGRATALTGQTSFNHGLFENTYKDLPTSLPLWLQQAGYCTGFTGKYLNGYTESRVRPPGWTYWEPLDSRDPNLNLETGYRILQRDGTVATPGTFVTDHLVNVSRQQLADCFATGAPAFVALWPFAPHGGSDPEADYAAVDVPWMSTDPSFNEADIRDKPSWFQAAFSTIIEPRVNQERRRIRTLLSVDDGLAQIIWTQALRGQLANTIIILSSDNGYLLGEHRVVNRKKFAYEAAQPPLWIFGADFPAGATSNAFAMNIDLAPTLVRASGATADLAMDGRPLQDVLVDPTLGHDRFLPIYIHEGLDDPQHPTPRGTAVRTWRFKYVLYSDGSEELYDLAKDPYELQNRARWAVFGRIKADMNALLQQATMCSGDTCRVSAPAHLQ
jgi:N-acetylglucosamine-6-sulfatase